MRRAHVSFGAFSCALSVFGALPASADHEPSVSACIDAARSGQALRDEGHYVAAKKDFTVCTSESCPRVVREDCLQWLADVEQRLPTVVFAARDAKGADVSEVAIFVDGEKTLDRLDGRPLPLDPGAHRVRAQAGTVGAELSVVLNAGVKNRLIVLELSQAIAPSTAPRPHGSDASSSNDEKRRPTPVLPLVVGGVGLVAVGTGAAVAVAAYGDLNDLEAAPCASDSTCKREDVQSVRRRFLLADVIGGVGLGAIGVAAWLWFTRASASASHASRSIDFGMNLTALAGGAVTCWLKKSF
jgi:hypothetical protein